MGYLLNSSAKEVFSDNIQIGNMIGSRNKARHLLLSPLMLDGRVDGAKSILFLRARPWVLSTWKQEEGGWGEERPTGQGPKTTECKLQAEFYL